MGAADIHDPLTRLRAAGLTVTLDASRVIVQPSERLTDELRQTIRDHRAEIVATLSRSWCWWLAYSESKHLIVYFHPEATRAEVLERYPGVLVAEPYTPTADSHPHPETDERNQ